MADILVTPSARKRVVYRRKAASTAIAEMDRLVENGSGEVTPMSNPNEERIVGHSLATVTASSSDYASLTRIPILIDEDGEFKFTDAGATFTEADEGLYIDFDSTAPKTEVDRTASTYDQVYVTKFLDATHCLGKITRWASSEPPATN